MALNGDNTYAMISDHLLRAQRSAYVSSADLLVFIIHFMPCGTGSGEVDISVNK